MILSNQIVGNGEETLVFLHGYPLNQTIWNDTLKNFTQYRCVTMDLRGHGESEPIRGPISLEEMSQDVLETIQSIGLNKFWLIGHSMGGYVACELTQKTPNQIKGLFLVASHAAADSPEKKEGRYKTFNTIQEDGFEASLQGMLKALTSLPEIREQLLPILSETDKNTWMYCQKAMADRRDFIDLIKSSNFPVVFLAGEQDAILPFDFAQKQVQQLPNAHLIPLNSGHMPMLEVPEALAKEIEKVVEVT